MSQWILYSFIFTLFYQTLFYVVTLIYRFDKVTDLAGTSNFFLLAVIGLFSLRKFDDRQFILAILVCIWTLRLGIFLLTRILVRRKDSRFDKIRDSALKLAGFWGLQAVWVAITSLPVTLITSFNGDTPVDVIDYAGWGMWLVGFLCEAIADHQRYRFNQKLRDPKGKPFLDTGLWRFSRHPNYFGEVLLWSGIWVSVANGLWHSHPASAIVGFLSPLITFVLLVFVSGIPLAEAREDRKNHVLMAYKQYKFCTSVLIPMPRVWYAQMPIWAKKWLFFDRYQLAFMTPASSSLRDGSPYSFRRPRAKILTNTL